MSDKKTEDLVPTMKLRWRRASEWGETIPGDLILQQWHYDQSRPGPDGLCREGKWIDVPFGKD